MLADHEERERDRIYNMTRDQLINEHVEQLTDLWRDDGAYFEEMARCGHVGAIHYSDWELRYEQYEITEIPPEDRKYRDGEKPPHEVPWYSVGDLVQQLHRLSESVTQRPVMMQHNLDNDVIIGARITEIRVPGFHQVVELHGPNEPEEGKGKKEDP